MANVQFLSIQDCWKQHMFFFAETCYVVHFNNPMMALSKSYKGRIKWFFLDNNGKRVSVSIDRCKPAFFLNNEDLQLPQTKKETPATVEPNATASTPATVESDPTASTPTQPSTRSGRKVHLPTRPYWRHYHIPVLDSFGYLDHFYQVHVKLNLLYTLLLFLRTNSILQELDRNGLDIQNCRGQGYDNGANMVCINKGVRTSILNINPRAFFTPCRCHSWNLLLIDAANSSATAKTFFGFINKIYVLFSKSSKRWDIVKTKLKLTLNPLSETSGKVESEQ
ncbi:zinc finger MYM-type protein 1 [Trichonephila clavipes]|nr:zinc finger MYM-type protein 1 [Trichonephila clavipes]